MTKPLPMLTRPRHDGWTPEVQQLFLDELAVTASPALAAVAAGRSLSSAYRLRARPKAVQFRDGWAAAMMACMVNIREMAVDHAMNGHIAPIMKYGRKVGERHVVNDRMLLSLMRLYDAPAYHADRAHAHAMAIASEPALPTDAQAIAYCKAALAQLRGVDSMQVPVIVRDMV